MNRPSIRRLSLAALVGVAGLSSIPASAQDRAASRTIDLASGATAEVMLPGPDGQPVGDGFTSGAVIVTPAQMEEALGELVREYQRTGRAGTLRQSTVMVFPYGHSQPVLAATPLRASVIELQAGEAVLGVVAGDTERFAIEQTQTGPDGSIPLVVVKPLAYDVTTNLVVSTDRRVYHVTLDSAPDPSASRSRRRSSRASADENPQPRYARHIRFYYPDEAVATTGAPYRSGASGEFVSLGELDFGYTVVGHDEVTGLVERVFDDGVHVYVQLGREALRGGAVPVLYVRGPGGVREVLNYAYDVSPDGTGTYVTDRTADAFELVLGATVRTGLFGLGGRKQVERVARILHHD